MQPFTQMEGDQRTGNDTGQRSDKYRGTIDQSPRIQHGMCSPSGERPRRTGPERQDAQRFPPVLGLVEPPAGNRTGDPILTLEPPGTAVRNAIPLGHARP